MAQTCFPTPEGQICRAGPDFACAPELVLVCSPTLPSMTACRCEPPKVTCEVKVTFDKVDPAGPSIASTPGCDAAGMELALSVALARLLGARF